MNDIVREFLLESHENLAQLDLDLVTLEKDPGERETLARAFRTLHTVKGTAGFLGLAKLQAVGHAAENLLSRLRSGDLTFNPVIATALLGAVDAVRKMLAAVEATEREGDGDYSEVIAELERLTRASAPAKPHAPPPAPPLPARPVVEAPPAPPPPVAPPIVAAPPIAPPVAQSAVADTSIRVDVGLLDQLMTLVGELVLARNQIVQLSATHDATAFTGPVQRLNVLTTELQTGVMKTRMQPIGSVWTKFPRLVRDLALACDKRVRLEMEGQETELDRTIIEAIRDPLTHVVRNAVDHGIEPPGERRTAGKPAEGVLLLRAFHEGGKVAIEIADDGAGIDPQRVRDKALAAQVVTPERAARMTDHELLNLVFLPGFSTADRVTHFSGRGVGMDVVRTNVEKIGGTVDIESRKGRGTAIKLKIPLTLAIIPALTVTAGGDRYAIPQVNLIELLRLEDAEAWGTIEHVYGAPVYRLRGALLPLVYLDRALEVEPVSAFRDSVNVVVVQADDRRFGLVVDDIHDTEEIVVKPLQKLLKGSGAFSGATIMGDGRVALILDVQGLAHRAGLNAAAREAEPADRAAAPAGDRQRLLLFAPGAAGRGRMAVPVDHVARLEEVPRSAVERVGGRDVIQYRGELLPLLHVARALRTGPRRRRTGSAPETPLQVVVYAHAGRRVGLVVGRILDIVDETVTVRSDAVRRGVLFNAVVQDRVTEMLDVDGLLADAGQIGNH